jgi:excisionase family DNA binding protein
MLGGVSRDYVYRLIRAGELQSLKLGGRRFIPASELERIARGAA